MILASTHVATCVWYLTARSDGFSEENWIAKKGIEDLSYRNLYVHSFSWAVQTVTLTGYGSPSSATPKENVVQLIWMVVSLFFYSYLVGNFSSFLSIHTRITSQFEKTRQQNIDMVKELRIEPHLRTKIQRYIQNNKSNASTASDYVETVKCLSDRRREDLYNALFGQAITEIDLFLQCDDVELLR